MECIFMFEMVKKKIKFLKSSCVYTTFDDVRTTRHSILRSFGKKTYFSDIKQQL